MNGTVNHISRRVDGVLVAALDDLPVFVDQDQIGGRHPAERLAVRVDPHVVGKDRVADCDVAADAFVVCVTDLG